MKPFLMKFMTLIFSLSLLSACGDGGGSSTSNSNGTGDSMTVTVVSKSTGTTTTTYNGNGSDPVFSAGFNSGRTIIQMGSAAAGVFISADGTSVNSYPISQTGSPTVKYTVYSSSTPTTTVYSAMSGTVTLTSVGNIGQPVTGSFEAYLIDISKPTSTLDISGTFSATRQY